MPAKRLPPQLVSWHSHVAFTRDRLPVGTPYKEVLKVASNTYRGDTLSRMPYAKRGAGILGSIGHLVGNIGDAVGLGKKRRAPVRRAPARRRGGAEDPHAIAGLADPNLVAGGILGSLVNAIGLGKKRTTRKPAPKRRAPTRRY